MTEGQIKLADFEKPGRDATQAIAEAIQYAATHQIETILFEPKTYFLRGKTTIKTRSIAHDDGCGLLETKDCHLVLKNLKNLTLKGALDERGEILTVLSGDNPQLTQARLPSIIWAENCAHLTLENMAFTRSPECAAAGIVETVDGTTVTVRTFPGVSCFDGMGAYCMNKFELETRSLRTASITYGFGIEDRWQSLGGGLFAIRNAEIARAVRPGDGLSWHQAGLTDFLLFFGNCRDLSFKNVRVYNTNSFAILTERCRDIKADGLVLKPKAHQFFTGPRDGWKIYRCTGRILLNNCHIEGVRMDGQNVHSNFMVCREILGANSALFSCKYAPLDLEADTFFQFYRGAETYLLRVADWSFAGSYQEESRDEKMEGAAKAVTGTVNNYTLYRLVFTEKIPAFVREGTLGMPTCWEPEAYHCANSTFLNIAGAGHLLRCGRAVIENCTYRNIMNAGILVGAELSTHCEGGHAAGVRISNCSFENCGFKPRYGKHGIGCIASKAQGFTEAVNKDLVIENCAFANSARAIELCNVQNVSIRNCQYHEIGEEVFLA